MKVAGPGWHKALARAVAPHLGAGFTVVTMTDDGTVAVQKTYQKRMVAFTQRTRIGNAYSLNAYVVVRRDDVVVVYTGPQARLVDVDLRTRVELDQTKLPDLCFKVAGTLRGLVEDIRAFAPGSGLRDQTGAVLAYSRATAADALRALQREDAFRGILAQPPFPAWGDCFYPAAQATRIEAAEGTAEQLEALASAYETWSHIPPSDCDACNDTGTDLEEGKRCRCAEGRAQKTSAWSSPASPDGFVVFTS